MKVLIVEDEALLAMDIEAMVEDAGHVVSAEADSLPAVEALTGALEAARIPDIAFVDIQLAHGTSGIDVARLIRREWADTLIVFVTANPLKIPEDFAGAHGVIPKPFSRNGLMAAMRYIVEGMTDPPPASQPPASFVPSPAIAESWTPG